MKGTDNEIIKAENNGTRTILKNTVFLYVRMFVSMAVGLYTSRVVLQTLGVDDFGVYNVVGGIVGMMAFLNNTMASATSRFLNFEIGRNDNNVNRVFSTAFVIHLVIAIVVLLLGETLGYWFLVNKLVIPPERMFAAKVLLQFSLVTMFFNFTQVPFNACIIAYEKMKVYAYVGLAEAFIKLAIVISIAYSPFDKLIYYGFMLMAYQVGVLLFYRFYCLRNFSIKLKLAADKQYLKPMLSFSAWDLIGQGSLTVRTQGVNMLLNMFFGVAINAATGIATHVQSVLMSFSTNITTAFRPQIVKSCARIDYKRMEYLICMGATTTFLLYLMISMPLFHNIDFVLRVWLKDVPDFCGDFCKLSILFSLFSNFTLYPMIGIDATAKIRDTSIILGLLYMAVIPVSYCIFIYYIENPCVPYIYNALIPLLIIGINSFFLHCYISDFSIKHYYKKTVIPGLCVFAVNYIVLHLLTSTIHNELISLFVSILVSVLIVTTVGGLLCFDKAQRLKIVTLVKSKLHLH